jgi:ssDNA-binding Zn-finger/Zn-ribbon topoisomerase 1
VSCVSCPKCSFEIPVLGARRLPREFSVLCPNCGWRKEYQLAGLHDAKQDWEQNREIKRIEFGKKNEMKDVFIEPKAQRSGLVSWLLQ